MRRKCGRERKPQRCSPRGHENGADEVALPILLPPAPSESFSSLSINPVACEPHTLVESRPLRAGALVVLFESIFLRRGPGTGYFRLRLPLDKNEGGVKDKDVLSSAGHRFFAREVEDQNSGNENLTLITRGGRSFHQPSIRPRTSTMILLCEHPAVVAGPVRKWETSLPFSTFAPALYGMRERPINPAV